MIIDSHIHIFPRNVAEKALPLLSSKADGLPYHTDGTVEDTLSKMDKWGISKAVALSIATNPHQMHKVNDFAIDINTRYSERITFFGSVHPDAPDMLEEIERIFKAGIHGIKLHPEYQGIHASDKRLYPLFSLCSELGMPVVFHAGHDIGFPETYLSSPAELSAVAEAFPKLCIVCAHMGGYMSWDEVCDELPRHENIFIDTAFIAGRINNEMFAKVFWHFGENRIMYGSDCPWENSFDGVSHIRSLGLTRSVLDRIFYKNAETILM